MRKKGFTLIEIIISIALIAIIGVSSVVGINYARKLSEEKKIDKVYSQFDDALEVYLADHEEIYTNLEESVEGAVITLEVLKNEGLVSDGIKDPISNETIDYKNNYYVLADAILLSDEEEDLECEGQVGLNVIKSWKELSEKVDTSDIIYICPKTDSDSSSIDGNIEDLKKRIESLEHILSLSNLGSKNYVYFDTNPNTSSSVSFDGSDLWRIVSSTDGIELMSNNTINYNFPTKVLNKYKEEMLKIEKVSKFDPSTIYPSSGLKAKSVVIRNGSEYYLMELGDKEIKEVTCNRLTNYKTNVYLIDDTIYIGGDSSSTIKKNLNKIVDGEVTDDTFYVSWAYSYYKYDGTLDDYIINNCYINDEQYKELLSESDVDFSSSGLYDNEEKHYPLKNVFGVNYYSIFGDSALSTSSKSVKKLLMSQINSNLRSNIIEKKYPLQYEYGSTNIYVSSYYNDKMGAISLNDAEALLNKDVSAFIGKDVILGYLDPNDLDYDSMILSFSGGNYSIDNLRRKYDVYGYYNASTVNGYAFTLVNYFPYIKISNSSILLTNIDNYPTSYKTKHSGCTTDDLGTLNCPYVIKIGEHYSYNG